MGQLHDRIQKSSSLEYFNACPDTPDEYLPANGVLVRLKNSDGEVVSTYVTDQNYNGIFVFNDLEPGRYFIEMKADGYVTRKGRVNSTTVKADATAYKTIEMFRGNSTPFDDEVGIDLPASTPREESGDAVYDLSGRRLPDGPLPRGIYIRNGKRVIIE